MNKIESIFNNLDFEMKQFNDTFAEMLSSENTIIKEAVGHVLSSQGKQVRPMLIILSAMLNGKVSQQTYIAASLIELTHCASLVHDDIVDEAYMRRNMLSVYAIWRNKKSVLIGDYIFSRAIKIASEQKLIELLAKISSVIEKMSIGELNQSDATLRLDLTEDGYYEIINGKTAELISACGYAGALTAGATPEKVELMSEFGAILGMIFQIKDDMLDYSKNSNSGKLACNDIKEKKITLPLIVALRESNKDERNRIVKHIKNSVKSDKSLNEVYNFVMDSNGLNYCNKVIKELSEKAKSMISNYSDTTAKENLNNLIDYLIEREK